MNQVFVCGTYFHVYISILKIIYKTDKDSKSLLIINDHTPGFDRILGTLSKHTYFDHYIQVPFTEIATKIKKETTFFSRALKRNKTRIEFVEANSEIIMFHEFIKQAEINLFYNLGLSSSYFMTKYQQNYFRMLEDGTRNYLSRVSPFNAFKRKYILRTFIGDGLDDAIKEIEVQYPMKLDKRVQHKGKKLELRQMQEILSSENKLKISKIFMVETQFESVDAGTLLLITQPLSEDKFITEDNKVNLYNQVLQEFSNGYKIFIKCHPREVTDYRQKINYDFTEIPRDFPLELMDLYLNKKFNLGITLYSGALDNIAGVDKKIALGKEYVKKFCGIKHLY